jgi:hypothetical protein
MTAAGKARAERAALDAVPPTSEELKRPAAELKAVNGRLWEAEDALRGCERAGDFGPRFVGLARSVYRRNDQRAALKRRINESAGAPFGANLFLAFAPLLGWRAVRVTERRTALDFAAFLRWLAEEIFDEARKLVLVTDNLNTHTPGALYEAFGPAEARRVAERLEWHYTPKHGSWLNMAEVELAALSKQCRAGRVGSAEELTRRVQAWELRRNDAEVEAHWQFTTAKARIKLRRLYPSFQ